ncbi:MAG: ABC transporter ATP-binding protein [Blastochloris sp.]|nr:ABC transporter ATP-binding protein [Blastochloris sp.]
MVPIPSEHKAVETIGLSKKFKLQWRRGYFMALEPLDLVVKQGEIFGLLGPNGSGKSTTIKLLLGLLKPSAGSATVFGLKAGSIEARKRMGFLPENPYFPTFLNGLEVLRYYGKLSGLSGKFLEQRMEELLELVDLQESRHRTLKTYSKGMLQRIGLAQALLHDPDLLLLDEPTAGVDPLGSRQIRDILLNLKKRGKTLLFSSHLLEQVQEVADRVAILHQGQKLREGSLADLLEVPEQIQIKLQSEGHTVEEIRKILTDAGISQVEISKPQMKLEDYFIRSLPERKQGGHV